MIDTQPPLNPSRLYLLKLSTAELRNEVLRGVKLDRNWSSKYGPSARHENLMALNRLDQWRIYEDLTTLMEVDLLFAQYDKKAVEC